MDSEVATRTGDVPELVVVSGIVVMTGDVTLSVPSVGSVYFAVSVSPGLTYNLFVEDIESDAFELVFNPAKSNTPLLFDVSVNTSVSVSPVRIFVTMTLTVSMTVAFRFWSVSVITGASVSPAIKVVENTPEDIDDVG